MGTVGRRRLPLLAVLAVVAAAAAAGGLAYRRGYRLVVARTAPAGGETAPIAFGTGGDAPRLEDDFAPDAEVRNVILFIGDGMGFSHLTAARAVSAGADGRLFVERFPVTGWVHVHSRENLYTDSAAAATAMASGVKTLPRMLGITPDGEAARTVLEAALARGMRAGLITTSVIVDATPAGFVAHARSRRELLEIARQMARSGVELLISEGLEPRDGAGRQLRDQVEEAFAGGGYRRAGTWEDLQRLEDEGTSKVLALLPPGSLTRRRHPTVAELTELALDRLGGAAGGFFLMVEDEETDSGSHNSDLGRVTAAVLALDAAARRAVDFARRDGHTLVLVTADHPTGALGLLGGAAGHPLEYRWYYTDHTAEPVPLLAYGPGAHRFVGVLDNTDLPRILDGLLQLGLFRERSPA